MRAEGNPMMRKIILLALIAGAAYFVYQRMNQPTTEEDQLVAHLRDRYAVLINKFTSAEGRSGAIGMDTTFDLESVAVQVQKLRAELADLRGRLTEERAIGKARELADKIDAFCRKNEILGP
jgi:Mg-chelatase subunit ChlI